MSKLFNENMSSIEARMMLFKISEGKTVEQRALLLQEYEPIAEKILKREIALGFKGQLS